MAKRKLTEKQKKFLANKVEGMSSQKAALEAGYSPNTAKDANRNITEKPGFQEAWLEILHKAGVSEEAVANKIKEGLDAYKLSTSLTEPDKIVPDFSARHKYVETSLEQLGRKAKEASQPIQVAFINHINKEKQEFGI